MLLKSSFFDEMQYLPCSIYDAIRQYSMRYFDIIHHSSTVSYLTLSYLESFPTKTRSISCHIFVIDIKMLEHEYYFSLFFRSLLNNSIY